MGEMMPQSVFYFSASLLLGTGMRGQDRVQVLQQYMV